MHHNFFQLFSHNRQKKTVFKAAQAGSLGAFTQFSLFHFTPNKQNKAKVAAKALRLPPPS
ncbi:hypothetical protein [Sodaliphilus pleomorphus]|uniref:Uncharacterized protein n=1 Tax=Sodaliphilus pleomorphus TaxID=2606626 RepID=A0A6L5XEK8_9BACT|nr:hypothetical protein [Sodaliphilus pleomorphus]MSS17736.1 hypothetical protein [Sodaliphilus pleomorphus]